MSVTARGIESVLITERLAQRRQRPQNSRGEHRAFATLNRERAQNPQGFVHKLTETALRLCAAGSAGVSVVRRQPHNDYLDWHAVAGHFSPHVNVVTPRDFSPCGTTLETNAAQLFHCPGRVFAYLNGLGATVVELLVVPIHDEDQPLGTMWIASHDAQAHLFDSQERRFDTGDLRILVSLAELATAALQRQALQERFFIPTPNPVEPRRLPELLWPWRSPQPRARGATPVQTRQ